MMLIELSRLKDELSAASGNAMLQEQHDGAATMMMMSSMSDGHVPMRHAPTLPKIGGGGGGGGGGGSSDDPPRAVAGGSRGPEMFSEEDDAWRRQVSSGKGVKHGSGKQRGASRKTRMAQRS